MVPVVYTKDFSDIQTEGTLALDGFVKGIYNDNSLPSFGININIEKASFKYPDLPYPVDNIFVDININNPGGNFDNTIVDVKDLRLKMIGNPIDIRLMLKTPVSDPYIDGQLKGKSCAVVLVGENTAGRKWIDYEIEKAWNDKKGVVGIHIHKLKDNNQKQASKGKNPFETFTMKRDDKKLSSIAKCYNVNSSDSKAVYNTIKNNLADWIEEAIKIRNDY